MSLRLGALGHVECTSASLLGFARGSGKQQFDRVFCQAYCASRTSPVCLKLSRRPSRYFCPSPIFYSATRAHGSEVRMLTKLYPPNDQRLYVPPTLLVIQETFLTRNKLGRKTGRIVACLSL